MIKKTIKIMVYNLNLLVRSVGIVEIWVPTVKVTEKAGSSVQEVCPRKRIV